MGRASWISRCPRGRRVHVAVHRAWDHAGRRGISVVAPGIDDNRADRRMKKLCEVFFRDAVHGIPSAEWLKPSE